MDARCRLGSSGSAGATARRSVDDPTKWAGRNRTGLVWEGRDGKRRGSEGSRSGCIREGVSIGCIAGGKDTKVVAIAEPRMV